MKDEIGLVVTQQGHFLVERVEGGSGVSGALGKRIVAAFERGAGTGLLHLAGSELKTDLPPGLAFGREIAARLLTEFARGGAVQDETPVPDDLGRLAEAVPLMEGAEYVTSEALREAWRQVDTAAREALRESGLELHEFLQTLHPTWHGIGRVVFHLAEQKGQPDLPFAFLATYVDGAHRSGKMRHVPLGTAVDAARGDPERLLLMLRPVHEASQRNETIARLLESGELFHPVAWTADEAWTFLQAVPACQGSGIVVRLPDWWRSRSSRPQVKAVVGGGPRGGSVGLDALLDFDVAVHLDGVTLTAAESAALLDGARGLRLIKGRWVEVDPERLRDAMDRFQSVSHAAERGGLTFAEGMRLLSGFEAKTAAGEDDEERTATWSVVEPGEGLARLLEGLRNPRARREDDPGDELHAALRPYQRDGVAWLRILSELQLGACLADDMGLGKTIQVIAWILILRRKGVSDPHLLVVPASLLGNWRAELVRFAPGLTFEILHGSEHSREALSGLVERLPTVDVVITTYETVVRQEKLRKKRWASVVLDEAQAIKNPGTRRTRAVKALSAPRRIALTGTPIENRLGDLWSLFDFLCPGLLGSRAAFTRAVGALGRGGEGYGPLRRLVQPYILRRMKTDRSVIRDLPEKTEVTVYCGLTRPQAALYQASVKELEGLLESSEGIQRRAVVLQFLMRFKQICDHPALWTQEGDFDAKRSGKLSRLAEIADVIHSRREKVLVFTQFQSMTAPLADHLAAVFGRRGLVLDGKTRVAERRRRVEAFQSESGPPYLVLSLKVGGVGLNLTAASHVVHFDRWWNPAVEDQATDRAFRIGQERRVVVHKFVCRGTVEERIAALIESKQDLAREILSFEAEKALTEMEPRELLQLMRLDMSRALAGEGAK